MKCLWENIQNEAGRVFSLGFRYFCNMGTLIIIVCGVLSCLIGPTIYENLNYLAGRLERRFKRGKKTKGNVVHNSNNRLTERGGRRPVARGGVAN